MLSEMHFYLYLTFAKPGNATAFNISFMKKITFLLVIFASFSMLSQNFNGSTGGITDNGAYNYYTANVSGMEGNLNAAHGLAQVCLNISHTYDSDLNVELIAPDGTTINLF